METAQNLTKATPPGSVCNEFWIVVPVRNSSFSSLFIQFSHWNVHLLLNSIHLVCIKAKISWCNSTIVAFVKYVN